MLDERHSEDPVHAAIYSFWSSALLRAGLELNLFEHIGEGSFSAETLAEQLNVEYSFLQAYLESARVAEFLVLRDGDYALSDASRRCLLKKSPHHVGDLALHITNHWSAWGELGQLIKEGRTAAPPATGFVDNARYWRDYMAGQHDRAVSGQSDQLVSALDLSDARTLVDLGGGMASYSIALCQAYSQLSVDLVDFAEPLALAKSAIANDRLEARIHLVEGDFLQVDLPTNYDVALVSGVVCISSPEECKRVFQRAHGLLKPGGLLVVQDFFRLDSTPWREKLDRMMDLYLKIAFTPKAGDHCAQSVMSWIRQCDFVDVKPTSVPTQLQLITARKSGAVC